jgi:hypothetical protein
LCSSSLMASVQFNPHFDGEGLALGRYRLSFKMWHKVNGIVTAPPSTFQVPILHFVFSTLRHAQVIPRNAPIPSHKCTVSVQNTQQDPYIDIRVSIRSLSRAGVHLFITVPPSCSHPLRHALIFKLTTLVHFHLLVTACSSQIFTRSSDFDRCQTYPFHHLLGRLAHALAMVAINLHMVPPMVAE